MDLQVKDRLALVTGSTAGIGRAIAAALAREGAEVIVTGRAHADVERAAAEISKEAARSVHAFAGDLADAAVAARLVAKFPKVEILVNNLGIYEAADFAEISDADWLRLFNVNVLSGVRLARAYLPAMRAADWGRIIYISSESALQIPVEMIHYGVTKAAQIALARGLAESVAGTGITVNSILAGPTKSRGVDDFVTALAKSQGTTFEAFEKEFFAKMRPTSLIKRFATPEEVASLVAYVASPLASATTGAALRVDGGVVKSAF
jgi:NAD(P)-dependent dehydrogenase (short-subunit alcohol dehydrogenase family)